MGYVSAMGACFCCKRLFSFNPRRVPSYNGEPVCGACMERINRRRVDELGLPPHPIFADAYEPIDESEL
jgi:hypothetical protein